MNQRNYSRVVLCLVTLGIGLFTLIFPARAQTITTPEVYSFKQEAFSPVSFYTGQANISIPLYQIQTNEITVPISLNYIGGEGLRAINPYSSVGLGWRLTAGGAITRTVNQIPDETITTPSPSSPSGFFSLVNSTSVPTNDFVRNNAYTLLIPFGKGFEYSPSYEYSPDIFTFSFLGYTGSFVMGYDGLFHVSSKDIVSVTKASSFGAGQYGPTVQFTLTANDGTIFTFGSTLGSIVFSGGESPGVPYQMDAWYLCSIKATNGRHIDFNYLDNTFQSDRIHFLSSSSQTVKSVTSFAILNNIIYSNGKVFFTSSKKPQVLTQSLDTLKSVDKIVVQNGNSQTTRQVSFKYSPHIYNRYYTLDSLNIDDKRYSFNYYNLNNLPSMNQSFGTDYWGFYNGQGEASGPVTGLFKDQFLNQTVVLYPQNLYSLKVPNATCAATGILTSITYPTGGTETYTYEQNTCSYLNQETANGYYLNYSEQPQIAGGLRIASITLGNQIKKYKYVNSFDPNNPDYNPATMSFIGFSSSGILYKVPAVSYLNSEILNILSIEGEPPVTYSKVIEYLSDKSYTVYTLNSELDHPDVQNSLNPNYYAVLASNTGIFGYITKSSFVGSLGKNSSCALERGQVNKIQVYDSSNTLKRSTIFSYSQDPNRYSQYVAGIFMVGTDSQSISGLAFELGSDYLSDTSLRFSILHSYCIYTFPVYLTQEVVTDYATDNTSATTTTKYQYNTQKLDSVKVVYDSKGDSIKTTFKYPMDYILAGSGSDEQTIKGMQDKKMFNSVIEQQSLQLRSGVPNLIGGTINKFKIENGLTVPSCKYELDLSSPSSNLTPSSLNPSGTLIFHPSYNKKLIYDIHDTSGYVLQMHKIYDTNTSYLWSYKGTLPVVKGENVTNSILSAAVSAAGASNLETFWSGFNNIATDTTQQKSWKAFNTTLRNNATLVNARVSTYTYTPLVGMTSQTDPNGVTTYYEYDTYERLKNVRDKDQYILGRNYYHYYSDPSSDAATLNVNLSTINSAYTAASTQLAITANCPWTISSSATYWLTTTPSSGNLSGSVMVNTTGNTGILRSGVLTVTYGNAQTKTVTVTQAANTNTLSVDQILLSFGKTASTIYVNVTSNTSWTAAVSSGAVTWLRVGNVSGSGNQRLGIQTITDNNTGISRAGNIYLTTTDGLTTVQINVTQSY